MKAQSSDNAQPTIDLVHEAQQGDGAAREELFRRYSNRVLEIVRIRLGPRLRRNLESRDILQDALSEAVRSLERFEMRDESSLIRWLATIVEHQIVSKADYFTAAKRDIAREASLESPSNETRDLGPDLAGSAPTPSFEVGQSEERDAVRASIEELPDHYREVVLLRDYAGTPWDEIASEIGASSPDAARMMHSRALASLGKTLRERGLD